MWQRYQVQEMPRFSVLTLMEKEYVKITPAQFRGFVDQLPTFQDKAEELRKLMQETLGEKWDKILKEDYLPHQHNVC